MKRLSSILLMFVLGTGSVWSVPHSHQIEHTHGSYGTHTHTRNHNHVCGNVSSIGSGINQRYHGDDIIFLRRHLRNWEVGCGTENGASNHDHDSSHSSYYEVGNTDLWVFGSQTEEDVDDEGPTYDDGPLILHSHSKTHRSHTSGSARHTHSANHEHYHGNSDHSHSWDGHSLNYNGFVLFDSIDTTGGTSALGTVSNPPGQGSEQNQVTFLDSVHMVAPVAEDVDGDGDVDNDDLSAVAMNFGETPEGDLERYDVDGDGDIDTDDFQQVQTQLEHDDDNTPRAPAASLALQLERIKALNIDDPDFQHVIQLLERRLPEPAPKKTVLLANYPNPFNPETWIPYRLVKAADVTLTIYATNGQPVRTLALGHQPAGNYLDRARAAYWDGKNAFGESVASGIYFYSLTADNFSATRRMLIAK